tara:strand:- start:1507 stop:2370 length:864 start_codon:yes stop_codon:yes gene_type:complete
LKYIELVRLNNWVKNLFIFIPLFFSSELFNSEKFTNTLIVFLGFCFVASFVYIINDVLDLEFDKNHSEKKKRPIVSKQISIKRALIIAAILLLTGVFIIGKLNMNVLYLSLFYVILNIMYSFKLKHFPIIDFFIISVGFVIRILMGGEIGEIILSKWIILMVFLLSLFIAVSKRRDDVFQYEEKDQLNRLVVEKYSLVFMDKIITIISSVLIVSYLLFVTSEEVMLRYKSDNLIFTFIFVLLGIFRYNQLTYVYRNTGSPLKIFFKDRFLQTVIFLWIFIFFYILYF